MQRHMSLHHPDMPYAYTAYITNMGKCARQGPNDSIHSNRVYAGQTEKMRRVIFVFSDSYFSSFHSTQFTLITADSAVIKVLG